jgi:hypothetical protein
MLILGMAASQADSSLNEGCMKLSQVDTSSLEFTGSSDGGRRPSVSPGILTESKIGINSVVHGKTCCH